MVDEKLKYRVGALLYSPAINSKVAELIISGRLGSNYSMALCLEDTLAEGAIEEALIQVEETFRLIHEAFYGEDKTGKCGSKSFLPMIFVRVRNYQQIEVVYNKIAKYLDVFSGFIFPKYSLENAVYYNDEFKKVLNKSDKMFYMMPILESGVIVDYGTRPSVLLKIKEEIDSVKDYVLNVRVGGNDFNNIFGIRRHVDQTIYDILPISQILCDILTVFSRDYVVSGPVWEYYSGENYEWAEGLKRELEYDMLNGFIGKTVIHPNQIPVVRDSLKVSREDYEDAMEILNWSDNNGLLVCGSAEKKRMNEVNTHRKWANKIAILAEVYGIRE